MNDFWLGLLVGWFTCGPLAFMALVILTGGNRRD